MRKKRMGIRYALTWGEAEGGQVWKTKELATRREGSHFVNHKMLDLMEHLGSDILVETFLLKLLL